jgi:hypothetical protein
MTTKKLHSDRGSKKGRRLANCCRSSGRARGIARTTKRKRGKELIGPSDCIFISDAVGPGLTTICPKGVKARVPGYRRGGVPIVAVIQTNGPYSGRMWSRS